MIVLLYSKGIFDMTPEEQAIADDKMRAEITRLHAEIEKVQLETILKMGVDVENMRAMTKKINEQRLWIPISILSGIVSGSAVASVIIINKLMG